jgi:trehalose 6-phosphate synthase
MNLVAKEYVAAQDPEDPGVLILSRFAGAAIEFRHALLVNPYDTESVASAIAQALVMPVEERRARHQALLSAIHDYDIGRWQQEFLAALSGDAAAPAGRGMLNPCCHESEIVYPGSAAGALTPAAKAVANGSGPPQ